VLVRSKEGKSVSIPIDSISLEGTLNIPENASGLVIFAHGSGSSRLSTRNMFVASVLQNAGIGTLLFDLLTREEDAEYTNRFNIDLLTKRLVIATGWFLKLPESNGMRIGYFGASTGAAAALQAAAEFKDQISAVVSRGGRPDLAMKNLHNVKAASLLVVGGYDDVVIELNREAYSQIKVEKELVIVPKASHLFEEARKLEEVARLAKEWFLKYLR
jgi:pimeloyl-ACP methyl ester carboxylesterase